MSALASENAPASTSAPAQSTNSLLMVAPTGFKYCTCTAADNKFMNKLENLSASALTEKVMDEFKLLVGALNNVGVDVTQFAPNDDLETPDAVFPNNWFSTHVPPETKEPTLVLYPMKAVPRRLERRPELVASLKKRYARLVDLTQHELGHKPTGDKVEPEAEPEAAGAEAGADAAYLEGTGSLVLDRVNRIVYACLSERTHADLVAEWVKALGYERAVTFHATDASGAPIYHTNVMLCVASGAAIVCAEVVRDAAEREHLLKSLGAKHAVVEISSAQMMDYCANVLEVKGSAATSGSASGSGSGSGSGADGVAPVYLAMSTRAHNSFSADQRAALLRHCGGLVHADIKLIEEVGGGGVRCMLAELF